MLGIPTEVVAPADGIVGASLVEPGEAVEYGQELVWVELLSSPPVDGSGGAGRPRSGAGCGRARRAGRALNDGRPLMFQKILIANRGEIALRVLRACRTLGIEAVVVYSEADRDSLPVRLADEAICIGPADARRSYLSVPAVMSAAIVTGCDAIHPGYGFLSEDETFAEVVGAHGLTFIGPPPEVLDRFASKEGTRRLLAGYGLPTIPGSDGMLRDDLHALDEADRIGYPVLIKPSAGGGGKGMRMVRSRARARAGAQGLPVRGQGRVR